MAVHPPYVSMMRGTPLLVKIFGFIMACQAGDISFSPLTTAGVLALSLNAGAYLSGSLLGAKFRA